MPWDALPPGVASGRVTIIVERDGLASRPRRITARRSSPGIFTFEFGSGPAIAYTPADGQVATWGLPSFSGVADSDNTPGLSVPANVVDDGFEFGDRRFTLSDLGEGSWLEVDGALASQRCSAASAG